MRRAGLDAQLVNSESRAAARGLPRAWRNFLACDTRLQGAGKVERCGGSCGSGLDETHDERNDEDCEEHEHSDDDPLGRLAFVFGLCVECVTTLPAEFDIVVERCSALWADDGCVGEVLDIFGARALVV